MNEVEAQTEKMLVELYDRLWELEKRVHRMEARLGAIDRGG